MTGSHGSHGSGNPSPASGSHGSPLRGEEPREPVPAAEPTTLVTLRGGIVFPLAAVELFLDLERREIGLEVSQARRLVARPAARLTADDAIAVRHYRHALIALVRYTDATNAAYALSNRPTGQKGSTHATHR